jgi:FlaA1/EpsC-like NDP-sugar epimerase
MKFPKPIRDLPLKLRNRHFLVIDLFSFVLTPALAVILRTDGISAFTQYSGSLLVVTLAFMLVKLAVFIKGGLYTHYWRYASVDSLTNITLLSSAAAAIQIAVFFLILQPNGWVSGDFPRSIPFIDAILTMLALGGIRYSVRLSDRLEARQPSGVDSQRVLVAGAGWSGVSIVREMQTNQHLGMRPVAFVDDYRDKQGMRIQGIPVLGKCNDIARVVKETGASLVVIAMPAARGKVIREIVHMCEQASIPAKTIPGVYELLGGTVSIKQLRDIRIEDLLRREPVETDMRSLRELVHGKRVLVTGGGGSIGSELCRQLLRFGPEALIIMGHGENSVFEIHGELGRLIQKKTFARNSTGHETQLYPVIADIRFPDRMSCVFEQYRPDVVFHTAAHKHVHLMEMHPEEAVMNNVLGTRNLLAACEARGVRHFVLISTDKAVNPTGVMGVTKRVAELLVHEAARRTGNCYMAVRFGNVLGSRGSVVLTFQQQIAAGGPVTITDPEMVRYFMTIPEAVQLVMQAATIGTGGEVFMLDMGEPVKIIDLARDLIELSGLEEGRDIDIKVTGLRPGEKLFEEMFLEGEDYTRTLHHKIFTSTSGATFIPSPTLAQVVTRLEEAARAGDRETIMRTLQHLVPEYGEPKPQNASVVAALPAAPGSRKNGNSNGHAPLAPDSGQHRTIVKASRSH